MKKYILTEDQIKKVVDNIVKEQANENTWVTKAVQCFLNDPRILNAKLIIDGKTGPNSKTEKALMIFQTKKHVVADGVWGYNTQKTLTPEENKIWKRCVNKYEMTF